jgi:hypothetical protein
VADPVPLVPPLVCAAAGSVPAIAIAAMAIAGRKKPRGVMRRFMSPRKSIEGKRSSRPSTRFGKGYAALRATSEGCALSR